MTLSVQEHELYLTNLRARLPFRFGIAAMTALPHLFVRLTVEIDGRQQAGLAAEGLVPKWFTKDPRTDYRDDVADMLAVIEIACRLAGQVGPAASPFELWRQLYAAQKAWGTGVGHPPLLWNLGVSLVERAVIDAFCRARNLTLAQALRRNALGVRLETLYPRLSGYSPAGLLPAAPLTSLIVRHTVGLGDPLTEADIPAEAGLDDGLPQSLAASLKSYGLTHLKIKLGGDAVQDIARLKQIAAVLDEVRPDDFAFTLDCNEQYPDIGSFQAMWQQLRAETSLAAFLRRLLFVEQPLHRETSLSPETGAALRAWPADQKPPIIIDESDSQLDSLTTALELGYDGTSHKNCKGIFKGIANACFLEYCRRTGPAGRYILSGEDLTNIGPVALLQDLAMMANLGLSHVERNGQHYFAGLRMFPEALQSQVLAHHPDLYHRHPAGFAAVNIRAGAIEAGSVVAAPFGVGFDFDPSGFTPLAQWRFES